MRRAGRCRYPRLRGHDQPHTPPCDSPPGRGPVAHDAVLRAAVRSVLQRRAPPHRNPLGGPVQVIARGDRTLPARLLSVHRTQSGESRNGRPPLGLPMVFVPGQRAGTARRPRLPACRAHRARKEPRATRAHLPRDAAGRDRRRDPRAVALVRPARPAAGRRQVRSVARAAPRTPGEAGNIGSAEEDGGRRLGRRRRRTRAAAGKERGQSDISKYHSDPVFRR